MSAIARMSPVTQRWFAETFSAPTLVQELGWNKIADGANTLMLAPTGSGKTLAAFLWCLDRITSGNGTAAATGYRVLYVSPLKALAYDVERNLTSPLLGLRRVAEQLGRPPPIVQVDVRTGDTAMADRRRQARRPGDILITTPESLYLLLGSQARAALASIDTIIIDEIHALAPSKRGAHLAISLERLSHLVISGGRRDPQRIGLSATQRPLEVVARYLGGDRAVAIVDSEERPQIDLLVVVPVSDMTAPPANGSDVAGALAALPPSERNSLWPAIYLRLLDLILAHRSTIVFVNSRRLAERLAQQLSELAAAQGVASGVTDLVRAHHGSVARHERELIEDDLKSGRLRAITATSSLELGIDMGAVDLVVQLESPGAVARGLQRIGRANHHIGGAPKGRIIPKFRGDLLEVAAVSAGMMRGAIEPIAVPENCLDVLAQQLVAMCATEPWHLEELERLVRRTASYRALTRGALISVLDMLSGRYPSDDFIELRPRLTWDRHRNVITARQGARMIAVVNGGTIADRGLYAVHLGATGPRIGELDEEMVYESRVGETFVLGASTWRIEEITRDRVIVSAAPGEPGKMPFWHGDRPGRAVELGRAVGALCRQIDEAVVNSPDEGAAMLDELQRSHCLDGNAAANLIAYIAEQRAATGTVPTDRAITVERFRDQLGDWRVCILSPFGARVHVPWALLLQRTLEDRLGYPVHCRATDDGISLHFADGDAAPADRELFPEPDEIETALVDELSRSAVFAGHFRENAGRALLLPRRRPGQRTPLWSQRLRAQQLLGVALRYPEFPIILETLRECLRDVFAVPALIELMRQVRSGQIRIDSALTQSPSPFARSLAFDYVAAFLYQGDAPVAERRAAALALDRTLLRELLGESELRTLLDPDVIAEVEELVSGRGSERRARHADDLHDLLLRIGDLSRSELADRFAMGESAELAAALTALTASGRILSVRIADTDRWIACEDGARFRDALDIALPADLPAALLTAPAEPWLGLVARFARVHGPFTTAELAARFAVPVSVAALALTSLAERGTVVVGEFCAGASGNEYCDADVLRRIRRGTLARARDQAAAVSGSQYARFLTRWHGIGESRRGLPALRAALDRLHGLALPFSELEARILPARVADYSPRLLDELGAIGEVVWIGCGALGASDGRIALYRREQAAAMQAAAELPAETSSPVHRALIHQLDFAGASFLVALEAATPPPVDRAAVRAALWDLVWAGVVTNDTFAPLRSLAAPPSRRTHPSASFGGRWSLVRSLTAAPAPARVSASSEATAREHLRAVAMLDRWGVVSRQAAIVEELPGGLAAIVDVLRAMDDAGKVRRGFFVEGLAGRQYAWPGAIDLLRAGNGAGRGAADGAGDLPAVTVLSAVDPANPWGSLLPWPAAAVESMRPMRKTGAVVVLVDGSCVLYVEPRGKRLLTFAGMDDAAIDLAIRDGLPRLTHMARKRTLTIETINGHPALASPIAPALERVGARRDYRGLVIDAHGSAAGFAATPRAHPDDSDDSLDAVAEHEQEPPEG
jgi:ATP-dependent helicase Lhr and Lhr-like helicase